jgi:tetratricopeptide (TPR) repeat protein
MDNLDYIDNYFGGELPPEESGRFEKRIQEDPAFADEVSFYLSALAISKEAHVGEQKERFRELYRGGAGGGVAGEEGVGGQGVGRGKVKRMNPWYAIGAAAVILAVVVFSWLYFQRPADAPTLADRYIRQNLAVLPVKMGGADPIQSGTNLYNDGRFSDALQQFEGVLRADSLNPTALQRAAIVYLRMENYDKALEYFKKLETHTDPHVNPALFYEALTLMRRSHPGDPDLAKQLLKRIVEGNLNKKNEAQELLGKL